MTVCVRPHGKILYALNDFNEEKKRHSLSKQQAVCVCEMTAAVKHMLRPAHSIAELPSVTGVAWLSLT